jgi:hypothetical protein
VVWRSLARLSASVLASGLHQPCQQHTETAVSPFACELRDHLFAVAYDIDKRLAISLSRPPTLRRLYCDVKTRTAWVVPQTVAIPGTTTPYEMNGTQMATLTSDMTWSSLCLTFGEIREEILELAHKRLPMLEAERGLRYVNSYFETREELTCSHGSREAHDTQLAKSARRYAML